jgi:hypothetical protein
LWDRLHRYARRKILEWRSVFPSVRAAFARAIHMPDATVGQRIVASLYALAYLWEVVLPAVLIPAAIVFFLWVILLW